MEKIWLKSYPPGVPAEINPDAYQSIVEAFEQNRAKYHDRPAFYNFGVTITYKQLDDYSRIVAAYLQNKLQLKKGERVAIMLPNILQYPIMLFAILRTGLIVVNVNPLYTVDELTHQLLDSQANTIITLANFAHTVETALPQLPALKNIIVTNVGDLLPPIKACIVNFTVKYIYRQVPAWRIPRAIPFTKILAKGKTLTFNPVTLTQQDIAFLQYTGGTTGIAKAAMLTHRNMIANVEQVTAWFKAILTPGQEIIITPLPLYHIFSLMAHCFFFANLGAFNILITNPRDLNGMIKEMQKFPFTAMTGVNTLFNALLKNPNFAQLDFTHLKLAFGGGMAVQQAVAEKWQAVTHAPLLEGYGLTETSPCVTINPPPQPSPNGRGGFNSTIGLPVPSTDIAILDDNHREVPIGQPGELAVKGPQVMQGYWHNLEETAKVFTREGWLLTGDIATIDEQGYVRLLERKKDMILVSGFNVYPNEIESVLAKLSGVREVAVIGMPDEHSGEVPKAYIVKDNPDLTAEQVINYCRQHLTAYKVPKYVEFRDSLPKSNVGKILRRALRP